MPVATYVAAAGPQASDVLYPSDRFAIAQIVVGGYVAILGFDLARPGVPVTMVFTHRATVSVGVAAGR